MDLELTIITRNHIKIFDRYFGRSKQYLCAADGDLSAMLIDILYQNFIFRLIRPKNILELFQ